MLRRYLRPRRRLPLWFILTVAAPFIFEVLVHLWSYDVPVPPRELDPPFSTTCQEPDTSAKRENAVLVMLTRNWELEQANRTITSIEKKFNQWYHYPVLFMNDEEWDPEFVRILNETTSGKATFEVIPPEVWSFPRWMDANAARKSIKSQGARNIPHAGDEGYHHMCRFYSGAFYNFPPLKQYKWYWRLEPDVEFMCAITYDPFVEMAKNDKVYGFTISLWEESETCPQLFRDTSDWKQYNSIPTNNLWKAMVQASWMPWPLRGWLSLLGHRDRNGDSWSLCHYWSNFEIANMDFFRTPTYQSYFQFLERRGGFYFERWGDAAVHSLYVAMAADPRQVHHFEDFGYRHDQLYQCPSNSINGQMPESSILNTGLGKDLGVPGTSTGIGCRCECDGRKDTRNHPGYCLNKLKQPNSRKRPWLTWLL